MFRIEDSKVVKIGQTIRKTSHRLHLSTATTMLGLSVGVGGLLLLLFYSPAYLDHRNDDAQRGSSGFKAIDNAESDFNPGKLGRVVSDTKYPSKGSDGEPESDIAVLNNNSADQPERDMVILANGTYDSLVSKMDDLLDSAGFSKVELRSDGSGGRTAIVHRDGVDLHIELYEPEAGTTIGSKNESTHPGQLGINLSFTD